MTAVRSRCRILADSSLVILFLVALCVPAVRSLSDPAAQANAENRRLAPEPEWRWKRAYLLAFPAKFEAFFNDRFGYRDTLIHWMNLARVCWLRTSTSNTIIIGKKGWLYYTDTPIGRDYENVRPFTDEELQTWQHALEDRRAWLAARGIHYYFVIAPDKQTIYPEMLPDALRQRQGPSRLDQLQAYLQAHSDFRIVDLREPLLQARDRERLYCITDSHWNERGGYLGYRSLMTTIAASFPGLQPLPRSAFTEVTQRGRGGDLAHMLGLDDWFGEEHLLLAPRTPRQAYEVHVDPPADLPQGHRPLLIERPEARLPRAVMFHDSFADCLIPFLSEHFRRILYLPQEPHEFDYDLVEREHPDIVIQETVERKLSLNFANH
jgi:hypothetical protein